MNFRFWLKLAASLLLGGVCVAYTVHGMKGREVLDALRSGTTLPFEHDASYVSPALKIDAARA